MSSARSASTARPTARCNTRAPASHALTMDDRMTIANMAIEAGGKNGIFPADEKTFAYVDERTKRNGTKSDYTPVEVDKDQNFVYDDVVDLSKLEPTVAQHPDPGHRALAKELRQHPARPRLHRLVHGRQDLAISSRSREVLKGRSVKIDTFGVPATPEVVHRVADRTKLGDRRCGDLLESAGVQMTENASCAACLGGPVDTFGRMNKPMNCI